VFVCVCLCLCGVDLSPGVLQVSAWLGVWGGEVSGQVDVLLVGIFTCLCVTG